MKRQKLHQFAHLSAGFFLLLHGANWLEKGLTPSVVLYLVLAAFLLLVAGMHHWVRRRFHNGDEAFLLLASAAFYFAAFNNYEAGKFFQAALFAVLGVAYMAFSFITIMQHTQKPFRRRRKHRRHRTSIP